ncbi:MAG: insulinase family protein [Patescibacteria group bacterium]|nr:insulinase family protein [Patescibacteria group bacterium]
MEIKQYQLKNGLSVILIDTEAFPTLTTLLLVGAGSRYENEKNNGIAHFFEHMAFKGSKKYPDTLVISSIIEGLGGIFNAFTSKDHTGYWIKSTIYHFETVIDVLADMIQNPLLKEEEIEREKGVVVEEINLYEDTPYRKIGDYFEGLLYQDNPLGFDIAGKKETVRSFKRKTFIEYIQQLYQPENAVLVLAGGLNQVKSQKSKVKSYLEIIEEKFGRWKKTEKKTNFIEIKEKQDKPQIFVKTKKTEQAHFCLGYRTFSFFDKKKYPLTLLSTILGGGMSSRLFIEVRERQGLCYYISTSKELYHDCGNLVTQAGVPNDLEKIKLAVKTILKEQEKIANGDLKKEELKKAKELVKGRLLLSLEDSYNIASFFGIKKLLQKEIKTPQEEIEKLEEVTIEEIISLAKEIFVPQKLNFALIGPFDKNSIFF